MSAIGQRLGALMASIKELASLTSEPGLESLPKIPEPLKPGIKTLNPKP